MVQALLERSKDHRLLVGLQPTYVLLLTRNGRNINQGHSGCGRS